MAKQFRMRRVVAASLGAAVIAAALTGCFADAPEDDTVVGEKSITIEWSNFPNLDPQVVTQGMWFSAAGIFEGLVVQNDAGDDVQPAVAESWDVSEDGTVYTFHLRDDAKWSDGTPVTAQDFVWTYERLLSPSTADTGVTTGANSYQPSQNIVNAQEFLSGTVTDWSEVGIVADDEHTIEFTLNSPTPGFLFGLTHPSMLPLQQAALEEHPEDWQDPENFVSNGPFTITSWQVNASMKLAKNKEYWDAANVALDEIDVKLVQGFAAGTAAFENGEVDITAVSQAGDIRRFEQDPELSKNLLTVESNYYQYLGILRSQNPLMEDVRIREALSLALDRENLATIQPGTTPADSLVFNTVPGRSEDLGIVEDVERAKELLADAGYPDGEGFPQLKILANGADPALPMLDGVVDAWKKNLGITVVVDPQEAGVMATKRFEVQPADYVGFYAGAFGGQPTWSQTVLTLWNPTVIQTFSMPAAAYQEYLDVQADTTLAAGDKSAKLAAILEENASDEAKEFAELADEARMASDEDEQVALFNEAAEVRDKTFLAYSLVYINGYYAANADLTGVNPRASQWYYFKTIAFK